MKKRFSFKDKQIINDYIAKLMAEGYSETGAREILAEWLRKAPTTEK